MNLINVSKFSHNEGILVHLYGNDLLIFGTDIDWINGTKEFMAHFYMKDLGLTNVIIGIKILIHNDAYL